MFSAADVRAGAARSDTPRAVLSVSCARRVGRSTAHRQALEEPQFRGRQPLRSSREMATAREGGRGFCINTSTLRPAIPRPVNKPCQRRHFRLRWPAIGRGDAGVVMTSRSGSRRFRASPGSVRRGSMRAALRSTSISRASTRFLSGSCANQVLRRS